MAEEKQPASPKVNVVSQYIRDMSFENFAARTKKPPEAGPDINVQVNLDAAKLGESFEVILKLKVDAKSGDNEIFLLELEYAGVFNIQDVPEEHLHPVLMIECPRLLFPFARRIVRDTTADGGFPPLNVDSVDFLALYRAEIERRAAQEKAEDKKVN